MKLKKLFRTMGSGDLKLDKEKRVLEFPFSSELPVERYFGKEVLSHAPGSCDMSRIEGGAAPLLFNHDPNLLVGVVESGSIASDKRGYAQVKFSRSAAGEQAMQDVEDGIIRNVSFGYMINEMVLTKTSDKRGEEEYTATSWTPYEISLVSIPADPTVGIGRSADETEYEVRVLKKNGDTKTVKEPTEQLRGKIEMSIETPVITVDADKIRKEAQDAERARAAGINALGERLSQPELARQLIDSGKSLDEARQAFLDKVGIKAVPVTGKEAELGLSDKEVRSFSFLRVLNALGNPHDRKAQEAAAFEFECSRAAEKAGGKASRGIMVPFDVLRGAKRDLTVGSSTAGGNLVSTDLLGASFIELLRNKMVLDRAGATIFNGLQGNIAIPRATGSATAYHVGENAAPTESAPAFDQVTMSPKTIGAYIDFSRRLAIQSSIDVENFVKGDLAKVLALAIDSKGLYGSGSSNQPTGLQNVANVNTKDFAADAPTFAEIIAMETEVAADNADVGTLAYLVNARGRGVLKGTTKTSPSTEFIWEPGNTVNGYRTEVSNQVSLVSSGKEHYWFGNWADLVLGFWSGLDLMVDPYTGSKEGTIRVVALQDYDVGVRHPESFCLGSNLT